MRRFFILTKNLDQKPYSDIIGYPQGTPRQTRQRISEMQRLNIQAVSFTGSTAIGKLEVLGKGHVGVVVLARAGTKKVALKIRRIDSQRGSMSSEVELLKIVNAIKVGPKFYNASKNCIIMEYVKGQKIVDWVRTVSGKGSVKRLKPVIKKILEDCYRMDQAGVDHGELSSISKHVIVGKTKQTIIDFESSSTQRRASNVTSATQAIFIGSGISKKVQKIYKIPTKQKIIDALRLYKKEMSRQSFEDLLKVLKLS